MAGTIFVTAGILNAGDWAVAVDYYETCSCDVLGPCLFGREPTNRECLGQGFMVVTKGHYGDVDLTGLRVHSAFKMGEWERYTVCDKASIEMADAMRKVIEAAFVLPGAKIVSYKQGPVVLEKKDGKIAYSAEGSQVVLEPVVGTDGSPMRLENHPMFPGYEQYRSVESSHKSEHGDFAVNGTNGLTSKRVASSKS